ncbi:D-2-hydroxyglutarate dehydrogenase, mitochondrial-like isoform X3 [Apostichopus japonicus]
MMPAVYSSCLNRLISCNSLQLASRIQRSHHLLSDGYPACFAAQRTRLRGSIKDVPRTSIAKFKRHILEQKHYQSKLLMFSTTSMLLNREVPLTSEQYPSLKRGKFGSVEADDVSFFESILPGRVVTERDELEGANTDWLRICRGQSKLLLKPKTTEEVSKILQYCYKRSLAVVPQGGNTGLVGGSVPVFDEIVISTALMNEIMDFNQLSGTLTCQAGCILENLDQFVQNQGYTMPLDLGAKGSCHIGGNVATNAGGIRLLRYGSLHGNVLGVEAVLANGEVFNGLTTLRKDNTGYDLKQLFIGSEGTLGVITAVSLLCPPKPQSVNLAFLGCKDFGAVLDTLKFAKTKLGEVLSAFEVLDHECMKLQVTYGNHKNPLVGPPHGFYVVVETSGSNEDHDQQKMTSFLEEAMEKSLVEDGTLATDSVKFQTLWHLREGIAESLMRAGVVYKYDFSFAVEDFYDLVEVMRTRLRGEALLVCGYGHVGDGNLHLNIVGPTLSKEFLALIEPFVFDWTASKGGSVSAEHGLGFKKRNAMGFSKSDKQIEIMQEMKRLFDPKCILNPYKTIPGV